MSDDRGMIYEECVKGTRVQLRPKWRKHYADCGYAPGSKGGVGRVSYPLSDVTENVWVVWPRNSPQIHDPIELMLATINSVRAARGFTPVKAVGRKRK